MGVRRVTIGSVPPIPPLSVRADGPEYSGVVERASKPEAKTGDAETNKTAKRICFIGIDIDR